MSGVLTARAAGLIGCDTCHLLCRVSTSVRQGQAPQCPRCGALLRSRKENSLARTWSLIIAAAVLYLPANLLPITRTTSLGTVQEDTIMSGVIYFMQTGSWFVAVVIFVASILIPLLKLVILTYLMISVQRGWHWRPRDRTRLFRITEGIGHRGLFSHREDRVSVNKSPIALLFEDEASQMRHLTPLCRPSVCTLDRTEFYIISWEWSTT